MNQVHEKDEENRNAEKDSEIIFRKQKDRIDISPWGTEGCQWDEDPVYEDENPDE
jgi:hypothetical protein